MSRLRLREFAREFREYFIIILACLVVVAIPAVVFQLYHTVWLFMFMLAILCVAMNAAVLYAKWRFGR